MLSLRAVFSALVVATWAVSAPAAPTPDAASLPALQGTWCTAPHDDYHRGYPVIELRQFRDVSRTPGEDGQPPAITARMRSAMISTQSKRLEFVGAWVDYRFAVTANRGLKDASVGLVLSLATDGQSLDYKLGESRVYAHRRCGPADAELVANSLPPAAIDLATLPVEPAAAAPVSPPPAAAREAATRPKATIAADMNRSYCLMMRKTRTEFFSLVNQCTKPVNFTYCVVDPTTANGRIAACRAEKAEQLGEAGGYLSAGDRAYLSLPVSDRGRVVWFACEYPSSPVLVSADPPSGHCQ